MTVTVGSAPAEINVALAVGVYVVNGVVVVTGGAMVVGSLVLEVLLPEPDPTPAALMAKRGEKLDEPS